MSYDDGDGAYDDIDDEYPDPAAAGGFVGDAETLQALGEAIERAFEDVRRRVQELELAGQLPRLSAV